MTYMSVQRPTIQKAFAKAFHAGHNAKRLSSEEARACREIALLIWQACGDGKPMPKALPEDFPGNEEEPRK